MSAVAKQRATMFVQNHAFHPFVSFAHKHYGANVNDAAQSTTPQRGKDAVDIPAALSADFGHLKSATKTVARLVQVSPRAVEKWAQGDRMPRLADFLRLLPHSPSLQKMVVAICGMEADLAPDFQRELSALIQRHIKK